MPFFGEFFFLIIEVFSLFSNRNIRWLREIDTCLIKTYFRRIAEQTKIEENLKSRFSVSQKNRDYKSKVILVLCYNI